LNGENLTLSEVSGRKLDLSGTSAGRERVRIK